MKPSIIVSRICGDDDELEVTVAVSDGKSLFSTNISLWYSRLETIARELETFIDVHGGLYDIELGSFGPEYASGAARIRLHFHDMARICVSAFTESKFTEFSIKKIASRGELYFYSEPALLDNFIDELKSMSKRHSDSATLQGRV
jgi:hypothetical protein